MANNQKPGNNVIYNGSTIKIKDEKALLKKAQATCDNLNDDQPHLKWQAEDASALTKTAQKPSLGRQLVNALKEANDGSTPRDWKIQVDKHGRVLNSSGVRMDAENIHVIEKFAYDALVKRVAELESFAKAKHEITEKMQAKIDDQRIAKNGLSIELAAAKAEIEWLKDRYSK